MLVEINCVSQDQQSIINNNDNLSMNELEKDFLCLDTIIN